MCRIILEYQNNEHMFVTSLLSKGEIFVDEKLLKQLIVEAIMELEDFSLLDLIYKLILSESGK